MRIGLIFPSIYASEKLYGQRIFAPRELLTHLANGLVKRGHEVFVFSTSDFETDAKLVGTSLDCVEKEREIYKFRNIEGIRREWLNSEFAKRNFELNTITAAFDYAEQGKIDLLHSYHDSSLFLTHYFDNLLRFPTVYSLHDPLPPVDSFEYLELSRFKNHFYISLSEQMKNSTLKLNFVKTIYHGLDVANSSFEQNPSNYLLFMGRLVPEKGLHDAIAAVLKLNMQLKIGAQFPDNEKESLYFMEKIKPYLNKPLINKLGLVEGNEKENLYKQAKALLFPIGWEEPFGMVMIEAMACGTPIVGYNRGSVSEVVRDGVTGFIIDPDDEERPGKGSWVIKKQGVEGLVEAIKRIGEIDRKNCRKHVEDNFTVDKMVENYEKVYKQILKIT